jgi:hypothetical protein
VFSEIARGALQTPRSNVVMPGTAQFGPNPTPTRDPPQGGSRRYVLSEILINNFTEQFDYAETTARFKVATPSTRLHWLIGWTYEPLFTEDTIFPGPAGNWLVSADAWIRPRQGFAKIMRANNLFTNRPVPTSWEMVSGIDEVRGTVVVPASGESSGTGITPGKLWITAMWEPAAGWYPNDDELQRLFDVCRLEVQGILTSTNGAAT